MGRLLKLAAKRQDLVPEPAKLEPLAQASPEEIRRLPRSHLYGLLNFYREYIPTFAELTEPLWKLLSQDSRTWTDEAVDSLN